MGLRRGGELLAYSWGGKTPVESDWLGLEPLKVSEVYLHDAYGFKAYRWRRIIPYLCIRCMSISRRSAGTAS